MVLTEQNMVEQCPFGEDGKRDVEEVRFVYYIHR
jgi:hypothetical protein